MDSASRQQTSFGTIVQCEQRGRGHENYCHYTFPVGDEQYTGVSKAGQGAKFGQTAIVYYDSQDPEVSALEDFSKQSRESMRFVYVLLLTLAATVAFILWDRAPHRLWSLKVPASLLLGNNSKLRADDEQPGS